MTLTYERLWLNGPASVPLPLGWSEAKQERWAWLPAPSEQGRWIHRLRVVPAVNALDVRGMPTPAQRISANTLDARELKESQAMRKSHERAQKKADRVLTVLNWL